MPRRPRLHVPQGTYYVVQVGNEPRELFSLPSHYNQFEALLCAAIKRSRVRVHAYCCLPRSLHLAVQTGQEPLGRFVQRFTGAYARLRRRQLGVPGHLFAHRYKVILIEERSWLLPLVRYLHYLPCLENFVSQPGDWCYSSHAAYSGRQRISWLYMSTVQQLLKTQSDPQSGYRDLMSASPSSEEIMGFTHPAEDGSRVLGLPSIPGAAALARTTARTRLSFEQIVDSVTSILGIEAALIYSRSRGREAALARAVIAWHATERGQSLSAVAQRFGRTASTLSKSITRYRERYPNLFQHNSLRSLTPLA